MRNVAAWSARTPNPDTETPWGGIFFVLPFSSLVMSSLGNIKKSSPTVFQAFVARHIWWGFFFFLQQCIRIPSLGHSSICWVWPSQRGGRERRLALSRRMAWIKKGSLSLSLFLSPSLSRLTKEWRERMKADTLNTGGEREREREREREKEATETHPQGSIPFSSPLTHAHTHKVSIRFVLPSLFSVKYFLSAYLMSSCTSFKQRRQWQNDLISGQAVKKSGSCMGRGRELRVILAHKNSLMLPFR